MCSHCQNPVDSASEKTSRWFVAHQNEKSGPYSWRALLALASRGDLDPDAMLIKEHSERWLRARSLHALFVDAPAATPADAAAPATVVPRLPSLNLTRTEGAPYEASPVPMAIANRLDPHFDLHESSVPPPRPKEPRPVPPAGARRSVWDMPWVMEGLAAASISVLLGAAMVLGYYAFDRLSPRAPTPASPEQQTSSPVPDASR
jgi:hypothetical protein